MRRGGRGRSCQTGTMRLAKHHGLGNDFLVAFAEELPEYAPALAWGLCHRTRGVGADGLLWGLPGDRSSGTDITMVLFNADGSRAEMSGNGIRCLAHAAVRRDGELKQSRFRRTRSGVELRIGTDAGVRTVAVTATAISEVIEARVDMGRVGPGPEVSGIDHPDALWFTTADVGNPHLVVQVPNAADVDVATDGARLAEAAAAGGINVEFFSVNSDGGITLRVWERGVGVTEACGTGACAAAHAAHQRGLVGPAVPVSMAGGDVVVELGDAATLTGPSVFVADVETGSTVFAMSVNAG